MKKISKFFAAALSLVMAATMLSACGDSSSTSTAGSTKPTESVTAAESTAMTTESVTSAESTEPAQTTVDEPKSTEQTDSAKETPTEDVIIPLYNKDKDEEIHKLLNAAFTDSPTDANNLFCFTNFSAYFGPLKEAEKQWEEENKDYGKLHEIPAGKTFEIVDPYDSTRSSVDVCFHSYLPTDGLCMYSESNGTAGGITTTYVPRLLGGGHLSLSVVGMNPPPKP